MTTKERVLNCIKDIIGDNPDIDFTALDWDENIRKFGINSLNYIELLVFFEEEFNIRFDPENVVLDDLDTLNKLANYIDNKIG